jgi:hypothetical protein
MYLLFLNLAQAKATFQQFLSLIDFIPNFPDFSSQLSKHIL